MIGPDARDELVGETAGPAADVEHAHAGGHPGRVGERDRERGDVAPHEPVVMLSGG